MFPDDNNDPLYNTVDASMWYFYACHKYIEYTGDYDFIIKNIYPTLENIIKAYSTKTDFSIFMDKDYLISSGSHLDQVTWMDVRVGDVVVTPRHGKVVEINALWYNALCIMEELTNHIGSDSSYYRDLKEKVKKSFNERFFCEETGCLYDVLDENDNSVRPNQIWVLSLPYKVLDFDKAEKVLKVVKEELFNYYGLRSLSYKDPRFKPKYEGKLWDRDMAYHMGTTWGFLIGGFFDAYNYVNGYSIESRKQIKEWALEFKHHLNEGCINGIAEIFDGMYPNKTRGCYSQAWSVGELLRSYYENVLK
jgi:predicted glycogen debranching enzyme